CKSTIVSNVFHNVSKSSFPMNAIECDKISTLKQAVTIRPDDAPVLVWRSQALSNPLNEADRHRESITAVFAEESAQQFYNSRRPVCLFPLGAIHDCLNQALQDVGFDAAEKFRQ